MTSHDLRHSTWRYHNPNAEARVMRDPEAWVGKLVPADFDPKAVMEHFVECDWCSKSFKSIDDLQGFMCPEWGQTWAWELMRKLGVDAAEMYCEDCYNHLSIKAEQLLPNWHHYYCEGYMELPEEKSNPDNDFTHLDDWLDETLAKAADNPKAGEFVASPAPCFFCGEDPGDCECTDQTRLNYSLDLLTVEEVADLGYVRFASGRYERRMRPVDRPFSRFIADADPEAWVSLVNVYADELLRCPFENDWLPGDSIVAKEMAAALIFKRCADEDASMGVISKALDAIIFKPFNWRRYQSRINEHFDLLCKIVDQGLPITETDEMPAVSVPEKTGVRVFEVPVYSRSTDDLIAVDREDWESVNAAYNDLSSQLRTGSDLLDTAGIDPLNSVPFTQLLAKRTEILIAERDQLKTIVTELVRVGDMLPGMNKVNALAALIERARELVK